MSDALAAMAGGLGMAPGTNIGDGYALFEATHGTAPKYAGMDKVNPGCLHREKTGFDGFSGQTLLAVFQKAGE